MPLWMLFCCLVIGAVTLARVQGYVKMPSKWVAVASVFIGWGLLWREYGGPMVVEFWVDLLLFLYAAKLLELDSKRDVSQIMLLSFFFAMTHFLFDESLLQTIVTFSGLVMVMATLIAVHSSSTQAPGRQPVKLASIAFLQALPLLVILFVFFPRLSPFWTIPLEKGTAVTGLSDRLMLGDIHSLVQSDALAFRVNFTAAPPASRDLYWRALVLSEVSEDGWVVGSPPRPMPSTTVRTQSKVIDYELLSQPMRVPVIPSLDRVLSVEGASASLDPLGFVRTASVLQTVSQYQMRSSLNAVYGAELSKAERAAYLALPQRTNPLAQAYGASLADGHRAPDAVIQTVLAWYFDDFTYTLSPGASEGDSIDHFLFEARRGFCEHFAASFTWVMRAAGIPARVVLGYQGGAYNPSGNYIEVRQFDAHAWSEVWVQGEGWRRVDPTAFVAPERIEAGMSASAAGMDGLMTGEAWDYLDGWAYRNDDTGPEGTTFTPTNWAYSGINVLDGQSNNASASTPFPIGTYSNATASTSNNTITGFNAYPNPVKGNSLTVTTSSTEAKTVNIFNVLGRKVFSQRFSSMNKIIDISGISAGVYIMKVSEGDNISTKKLIIE